MDANPSLNRSPNRTANNRRHPVHDQFY